MITIIVEQLKLGNPAAFALIAILPPIVIIIFSIIDFIKERKKKK